MKKNAEMYVNEFIRGRGNLKGEPIVKPKEELIKIFGNPNPSTVVTATIRKKPPVYGPDGEELTAQGIEQLKEEHKRMLNYPRSLLIENRAEEGKEEVKLALPFEKQQKVNQLLVDRTQSSAANVNKNAAAQKNQIVQKLEEGFELVIPKAERWHHSHTNSDDFVKKLNTGSIQLLTQSLKKLRQPRDRT